MGLSFTLAISPLFPINPSIKPEKERKEKGRNGTLLLNFSEIPVNSFLFYVLNAFLEQGLVEHSQWQGKINPYIFTDSDVAVVDDLGQIFKDYPNFHLALTFRNNKDQPLNSGFIAVRGTHDGIQRAKVFLQRETFLEEIGGASVLFLPCAIYNGTPPEGAGQFHGVPLDVKVVHFKGSRKRLMLESRNFLNSSTSSDISDMLCLILKSGRTKNDF